MLDTLNYFFGLIDSYLGGSLWFIFLLLGTGLFFSVYLRFPQIRLFRSAVNILRGRTRDKRGEGDTSPFQALSTALSGTVGTGNISGVALAIHLGGAAALFWMLITAFLGMTTKLVEVTLAHKYREKTADGTMAGGAMYVMEKRLKMKWLAVLFAIATVLSSFGTGNLPQGNSIAISLEATFDIPAIYSGGVLALLLGMVIIGGIRRIARITSRLVPIMALLYFIGALSVIFYNYQNILPSFQAILGDLFTGTAATGGFLGSTIAFAFNRGVNRGLFSNEAGQGSSPIAHASAKTQNSVSEGAVAMLEPFIDTIIICMLTGLTLLASGIWNKKHLNTFQSADIVILNGNFSDQTEKLGKFLAGEESLPLFTGNLEVEKGKISSSSPITFLHARSVAEKIAVQMEETPYTGNISVVEGKINLANLTIRGYSLVHSAPLTAIAFTQGWFGAWGQYIVSIGLLLFAFSTAIAWSYYGDRAVIFLWGNGYVALYRLFFVLGFFIASFVDTSIVWAFSGIAIAVMTIPNLLSLLCLSKEIKSDVLHFEKQFRN